jgi:Polysaccharide biosynthesis protein.
MRNNTVILIKNLAQRGLMHMFGANVFNKIISFSGTILLVRILSKGEYGVYAYVQNILLFFVIERFGSRFRVVAIWFSV